MATLILNAGTLYPIEIVCTDAGRGQPINVGDSTRSFAGGLRNSIRTQKGTFSATTSLLSSDDEQAIQAAIANAAPIPCAGDVINGTLITVCQIRCASSKMIAGTSPSLWQMSLTGEVV